MTKPNLVLTADTSADCSFVLCADGLSPNTVYYIGNEFFEAMEPAFHRDAVRYIAGFQGLLNRDYKKNHTSLLYLDVTESDEFWLSYVMEEGKCFHGMAIQKIADLDAFFTVFAPQLETCGLILWDMQVPATANVAATVCGLDGFLPVRFCEEENSFWSLVKAKGFAVKQNLVGMFGQKGSAYTKDFVSCGSAKNDAYRWALNQYFHRCSSRYVAYVLDGAACVPGSKFEPHALRPFFNALFNHDYYIARRCFFFDLTCMGVERPCDDPEQPLGCDLETLKMILQARYDRAQGAFGQILGFPPWWVKYTNAKGMGSIHPTTMEWSYVALMTAYNLAKEADAAHPCSMSNASFYNRYESFFEKYQGNHAKKEKRYNPNVKYFTFYGGDYDSSAWLKMHVMNFWSQDEARGSLPLNWAFNPNLSERVPMVFDYIHEHKTENDFFTAGDTGAGYVIPAALYNGTGLRHLPNGDKQWEAYCKAFYDAFDLQITGFIINGHYPITKEVLESFARISPGGNFHNSGSLDAMVLCNGVPFVRMHNGVSGKPAALERSVKAMEQHFADKMKGKNFAAFRYVCDAPSDTKRLVEAFLAEMEKDNDYMYEYVDNETFFDLAIQSGQCQTVGP